MCALDRLHVKVKNAGVGVSSHCGVARVGERAGLSVAETSDVVFIAAEVLLLSGSEVVSA